MIKWSGPYLPILIWILNCHLPCGINVHQKNTFQSKDFNVLVPKYLHYQAKLEKEFQVFRGFEGFATQIMCSCRIWKCSMQAVFEIHWIEVYWFFCSCYLAETTSPLMGPNHLFSLLMYQNICFMGGPFPSNLENFQFCDNENRWSGQQFSIGLGWYFYPQMGNTIYPYRTVKLNEARFQL